jgi:hypothetical protein
MPGDAEMAQALARSMRPRPPPEPAPLRFSQLKRISESAAHFKYHLDAPEPERKKLSFEKGTALHSYLIGDENSVISYPGRRAGKAWGAFEEEHAGKSILIASEARDVIGMRDAIRRHPRAMALLDGEREETLYWNIGGRACRGTPDVRTDRRVVELKSGRSVRPDRFVRDGLRYAYHGALAWYLDGVALSGLGTPEEAWIVAVESSPPYPVTVFRLTDRAIDQGRRLCRLWFERLRVCELSDEWPEYVEGDVDFDVPDDDDFTLLIGGEEVAA